MPRQVRATGLSISVCGIRSERGRLASGSMAQLATVASAADLPGALDRKIDVVMLVVTNPGLCLYKR
jgi:hypothetical protein